jgi:hypothetical protein
MTEPKLITLNLTLKELQQIDKFVEINDDTLSVLTKIKDAYPSQKSPVEEAFKRVYGYYPECCERSVWTAFQKGWETRECELVKEGFEYSLQELSRGEVKPIDDVIKSVKEELENSKPMNEVLDRLENKYKDAEENAASYMTDEVVNRMLKKWEENPPDFLKFELGKTLEGLISDWLDDCVPAYSTWDYELGIAILIRRIEKWLPDFQSSSGSQNVDTELLVDGYNDALTKIKSKLRNKK